MSRCLPCALVVLACTRPTQYAPNPLRPAAEIRDGAANRVATTPAWNTNAVMRQLERIARSVRLSEYSYDVLVDESRGYYQFDCSGMAGWVLFRTSPEAYASADLVTSGRPLARDFHTAIASIPPRQAHGGWYRVPSVAEAVPGDLIAWLRPLELDSNNTGHVAFVASEPVRLSGFENGFLIRVVDSSASAHADDTRTASNSDGFGIGTIALATTQFGEPTHYSWAAHLDRFHRSTIVIGRPLQ